MINEEALLSIQAVRLFTLVGDNLLVWFLLRLITFYASFFLFKGKYINY